MSILKMLGHETPDYLSNNRMKLAQFGLGMMGQDGIGGAIKGGLAGGIQGSQFDQQRLAQQQEEKSRLDAINQASQQKNATLEYLRRQGRDDLLSAIEGGMPVADAWKEVLKPQSTPDRKTIKGADGYNYFLDSGERVLPNVQAAQEAPKITTLTRSDGSEVAVQWDGTKGNWAPIDAPLGGGTADPKDKLTETQSKYALFGRMQSETAPVLESMEEQFNPANTPDAMARSLPIAGNFFQSEQGQIYNSAAQAWAEGALRIATGAAATQPEIERVMQTYFAQPGDTPNTLHFKSEMRKMYARALEAASGARNINGQLPDPMTFAQSVALPNNVSNDESIDQLLEHMPPEDRALFKGAL